MTPWTVYGVLQARINTSPSPGDLPDPGIEPRSPALQADTLPAEPEEKPTLPNSLLDFPSGSDGIASAYNVGDLGSIPGSEISPGEGNGNPLQYSCLENPMDRGAW